MTHKLCGIQVSVYINKVLLEYSLSLLFTNCLSLLSHWDGRSEWLWQRPYGLQNLKYMLCVPFQKNFADPYCRIKTLRVYAVKKKKAMGGFLRKKVSHQEMFCKLFLGWHILKIVWVQARSVSKWMKASWADKWIKTYLVLLWWAGETDISIWH